MESEKVKEIKKALEQNDDNGIMYEVNDQKRTCKFIHHKDILTLINELESENERLNKSDTSKEESFIEYYNLYKDLKRKNKDLNELCELQRVSIAESFVRENQLKDRIAELEKENEILKGTKDRLTFADRVAIGNKALTEVKSVVLPNFAEMLIEKAKKGKYIDKRSHANLTDFIIDVDETLKEYLK